MNQQKAESSANQIVVDGIAYEVAKVHSTDERGMETLFVRRPKGSRFYMVCRYRSGAARMVC